jgi:hypothetical protein
MTAIDKFIRLEAVGWWFEAGRQEAREVIVSFGDSTLQISSLKDVPLTHWSLLATTRVGTRGEAVIYSADPEQHEVLEIEDHDMIRAISAVTSALADRQPKPLWRRWIGPTIGLGALLGVLWASPPFIYQTTTLLTSPARVAALSDHMLESLHNTYGNACNGWLGQRALAEFAARLIPDDPVMLKVFEAQDPPALALPNMVSLSKAAIKGAANADELAALVISYWAMGQNRKPVAAYMASLGPIGALRSLISGHQPDKGLPPALLPDGEDYITARDFLQTHGRSAFALQQYAKQNGIGLPLGPLRADSDAFTFDDFATLQNICDE